ncbi:Qat anti-phage system TatD family nuclease QatD [Massilia varians]|uniref:Qat anti-phage system TatD family nuclease QatD n=2 Tax=Massilia varians TaxID=457921 RepID=UPI00360A92AF
MMDFHCHLDLYPDARSMYAKAQAKMEFLWLVTTSPRAFAATSVILPASDKIMVSPGLHPEVADKKVSELDLLLQQMTHVAAVGEVGLDGSARYKHTFETQQRVFSAVVQRAEALGGRLLSIHSRAAASQVLATLQQHAGFGTAVLHWFTDSAPQLRLAASLGCWFSVGPAMLASSNGRKLVSIMPKDRIVPESDGPFGMQGGSPILPWEASGIADKLSITWGLPIEEVRGILRDNGRRLISATRTYNT